MSKRTVTLAMVATGGVLAGLAGAAARSAFDQVDGPFTAETGPAPPAYNRWIHGDGTFFVERYDDRSFSEAEKSKAPVTNPRWKPFNECLAADGYESRRDTRASFDQQDLDALVARVNADRPDKPANKAISSGDKVPGIAGSFLRCAGKWLAIENVDLPRYGLRELAPGETPTP